MLGRLIADSLRGRTRQARRWIAGKRLGRAIAALAAARFEEARTRVDAVLALDPELADAWHLLGQLACRGGSPEAGSAAFGNACRLEPGCRSYLAALADAELLQQRPEAALPLYERAFPAEAERLGPLSDEGMPWRNVHPDWTRSLLRVTLPPVIVPGVSGAGRDVLSEPAVRAAHLLNWALVLVALRRGRQAMHLLRMAVQQDPALGYAQAVLALLATLNQDWPTALQAAHAARRLGAEAFSGATDLCIVAAQLELGIPFGELDDVFDWSALAAPENCATAQELLPPVEGHPPPAPPRDGMVYFVACDPQYFFEYGIALACSIRESAGRGSVVHFHFYNPTVDLAAAWEELSLRLAPMHLSATRETVDYERFGGKGAYCGAARFSRLLALLLRLPPGSRVAMLDADSLVRDDVAAALSTGREIGLAHAPNEPCWHQYLAGFTAYQAMPSATAFLSRVAAFLATNLAAGRARMYMDQIALFAAVRWLRDSAPRVIDDLPVLEYCDTLFTAGARVWSVTQRKGADSAFERERRAILQRYGLTRHLAPAGKDTPSNSNIGPLIPK